MASRNLSVQRRAQPCPAAGEAQPGAPGHGRGSPAGKQLSRKGPGLPGWTRASKVPLWQRKLAASWAAPGGTSPAGGGTDPSPLLGTGKATPGALGPVLGPPVQMAAVAGWGRDRCDSGTCVSNPGLTFWLPHTSSWVNYRKDYKILLKTQSGKILLVVQFNWEYEKYLLKQRYLAATKTLQKDKHFSEVEEHSAPLRFFSCQFPSPCSVPKTKTMPLFLFWIQSGQQRNLIWNYRRFFTFFFHADISTEVHIPYIQKILGQALLYPHINTRRAAITYNMLKTPLFYP